MVNLDRHRGCSPTLLVYAIWCLTYALLRHRSLSLSLRLAALSLSLSCSSSLSRWAHRTPTSPPDISQDIEKGDVSSSEEGNTTTPSTLSLRRDSSMFHSGTINLPEPAPPPPPPPQPQAPAPPHIPRCPPPLRDGSSPPLLVPASSGEKPPPMPWAPWRRFPQSTTVVPSLISPPVIPMTETAGTGKNNILESVKSQVESGGETLEGGGQDDAVGEKVESAAETGELVLALKETVVSSDKSSMESIIVRVPSSPASPSSPVTTSLGEQRSPLHRRPSPSQRKQDSGGGGDDDDDGPKDEGEMESGVMTTSVDHVQVVQNPALATAERDVECGQKDDGDDFSATIANACLSSQGVWVTAPACGSVVRRFVQPGPSTPQSTSDCSEPRYSGATCWSSGVGGESGVATQGSWVGVDPLMLSPGHGSAASSSPSTTRCEAPYPRHVSPSQAIPASTRTDGRGSVVHDGITGGMQNGDSYGEDDDPAVQPSSVCSLSPEYPGSFNCAPEQVLSEPTCRMLGCGSASQWSPPLTPRITPPVSASYKQQRSPTAPAARSLETEECEFVDVECGYGADNGAGRKADERDTQLTSNPSISSPPVSPPTEGHQREFRTPPQKVVVNVPGRRGLSMRREGNRRGQDPMLPAGRCPRNRAVPSLQTHAPPTKIAPQPPRIMPPSRGLPVHAQPARAPAWGETPALSPTPPSARQGLMNAPTLISSAAAAGPSTVATLPPQASTLILSSSSSSSRWAAAVEQQAAQSLSPTRCYSPMSSPTHPPLQIALELLAAPARPYAPPPQPYTPPSPAGRSTSLSPSSVLSSPSVSRSHLMHGAAGAGTLPPSLPPRDPGASASGIPLLWSWSDSTMSACSRTGGFGSGAGSACMSASPDPASPLVGIRFIPAAGEASSASSCGAASCGTAASGVAACVRHVKEEEKSTAVKGGSGVVSASEIGARFGVGVDLGRSRSASRSRSSSPVRVAAVSDGIGAVAAAGESEDVRRADLRRHGGVGGREGKRPRRYFFPL